MPVRPLMSYLRQRPRIAPNGRVTVRLTTAQRDLFLGASTLPKSLGHLLHRAVVKNGKLEVRLARDLLEALIAIAARSPVSTKESGRALDTLIRYLEGLSDRFAERDESDEAENPEK